MLYNRTMTRIQKRKLATEFVRDINSKTVCLVCGKQPIEWHRKYHEEHPNSRVSSLRTQGVSVARIEKEIKKCKPYCRSCHMKIDNRLKILQSSRPYQKGKEYTPKMECNCCKKLFKPLRNGMCSSCDNHHAGRRLRLTKSCDGCCANWPKEISDKVSKD